MRADTENVTRLIPVDELDRLGALVRRARAERSEYGQQSLAERAQERAATKARFCAPRRPARTDFDAVRWQGYGNAGEWAAAAGALQVGRGADGSWRWFRLRYPLDPYVAARLREELQKAQQDLRWSLARFKPDGAPGLPPKFPPKRPTRPDWPTPETFIGRTSYEGVLTAAYLLGKPTPQRYAQLCAAAEYDRSGDPFAAFADGLLAGWNHHRSDAERQHRAGVRMADIFYLRRAPDPEQSRDDETLDDVPQIDLETDARTRDFAPDVVAELTFQQLPDELRHVDHDDTPLTPAQRVARHRARASVAPHFADALRDDPAPRSYRRPHSVRVDRRMDEPGWSRRSLANARYHAARARDDVRAGLRVSNAEPLRDKLGNVKPNGIMLPALGPLTSERWGFMVDDGSGWGD